jgi:Na+/proline symporter
MKNGAASQASEKASFSWFRAFCTIVIAGSAMVFYYLEHREILNEQQLMLISFIAVPIAAFLISGAGQDTSGGEESSSPENDSHNR